MNKRIYKKKTSANYKKKKEYKSYKNDENHVSATDVVVDELGHEIDALLKKYEERQASGLPVNWESDFYMSADPHNYVTGYKYQGINLLLTMLSGGNEFLTKKQVDKLAEKDPKIKIKDDARSIPIIKYIFSNVKKEDVDDMLKPTDEKETFTFSKLKGVRYYRVYRTNDIIGIDVKNNYPKLDFKPSEVCKEFMDHPICPVKQDSMDYPYYAPYEDVIHMKPFEMGKSWEQVVACFAHEEGHATGAKGRLDRPIENRKGDNAYAKEEMIAESCSYFCSIKLGILPKIETMALEYLKSWGNRFKELPSSIVVSAFQKGMKASEYIFKSYEEKENQKIS